MNIEFSPLDDIEAQAVPVREPFFAGSAAPKATRPRTATAEQLRTRTFEPIRWVVPDFLPEGCTILAGRPKLGKSWLMLDVGMAVARNGFTLGEKHCIQGDVLYIALEDNERRLQSRMTKVLGTAFEGWPARFHYATEWPRAHEGGARFIDEWLDEHPDARLVVVDVLQKFRQPKPDKMSPYEADYAAVQLLQEIAGRRRVAIVIVHHVRKGAGDEDPFEKVSGTMGITGAADTTVVLDRTGQGATLYGRGRDIEEFDFAVQFDRETCRWTILGEAEEVQRSDERKTILNVLIGATEPISNKDIIAATGMPKNNVDQLLFKMTAAGEVLKVRRGAYVHPDRADLITGV